MQYVQVWQFFRPEVNSTYGKTVATIRRFRDYDAVPGEADDASDAKIY